MCLKSKAASLLVLWCFLVFTAYYLSYGSTLHFLVKNLTALQNVSAQNLQVGRVLLQAFVQLLYPLGGMLGDITCGRYKIIKRSLVFLVVMVIMLATIAFLDLVALKHPGIFVHNRMAAAILALFCFLVLFCVFGFVAFFANALPYAMDQLRDAPAQESWLFIYFYVWNFNTCLFLTQFIFRVLFNEDGVFRFNLYKPISFGTITQILSLSGTIFLVVILLFIFVVSILSLVILQGRPKWLNMEHYRVNPYKLVYKVSKFAGQHKLPIRRSAFTYCEDKLPSGLDLGKSKYGGPFTTEEVEEVKVFYEILKVLMCFGPISYFNMVDDTAFSLHIHASNTQPSNASGTFDLGRVLILCNGTLSPLLAVIVIPLCICLSRHFKSCSLHTLGSLRRVEIGTILIIVNMLFMLAVAIASNSNNESCVSYSNEDDSPTFSPQQLAPMLVVQQGIAGISRMLLDISIFEFLCAQSPHSMKGMLIGLTYAIQAIFVILGMALQTPFVRYWKYSHPSCGFVYYSVNVVVCLASFIILATVVGRYKYRERDEPSRERQFAEEYYSNIPKEPHYDYSVSLMKKL